MRPKLEVVNLTKHFPVGRGPAATGPVLDHPSHPSSAGRLEVLRNVSLHVGEGEFVALVGPSGCGKSTLCNIVAGLIHPDSGQVVLDGVPAAGRRGQVAYMQQKDLLLPWRRVIDNAALGLEVQGASRHAARAEARDLLRRFGLERVAWYYPAPLSGGMRQRVALVRTLLCRRTSSCSTSPLAPSMR